MKKEKTYLVVFKFFFKNKDLPSVNLIFTKTKDKRKIIRQIQEANDFICQNYILKVEILAIIDSSFQFSSNQKFTSQIQDSLERSIRLLKDDLESKSHKKIYIEMLLSLAFYLGYHFNGKKFNFK